MKSLALIGLGVVLGIGLVFLLGLWAERAAFRRFWMP